MPRDRESVSLVAKPLHELQSGVLSREPNRLSPAGQPELLLSLGQSHDGELDLQPVERGQGRLELTSPAVDDDEIRQFSPLLPHPPVSALDRLGHAPEVIWR